MKTLTISYIFEFADEQSKRFDLAFNAETMQLMENTITPHSEKHWTRLDFHQCPHCPLKKASSPFCPLAQGISTVVEAYSNVVSHEPVTVTVETKERTYKKRTTIQRGISSLMGLIMPTSGCPNTAYLRPMARFHLPFSTLEETIYRSTSAYLLGQYFKQKKGLPVDMDFKDLRRYYESLHILNLSITQRLSDATKSDASINALFILDIFSQSLPMSIDDQLELIAPMYEDYPSPGI